MDNLDQIPKGDPFARGRGSADPLRERAMVDALSSSQLVERVRELETQLRIERENVAELEERLVLCQRTNDRMREQLGHKPPPWGMNK
jgi:hypothetical protein